MKGYIVRIKEKDLFLSYVHHYGRTLVKEIEDAIVFSTQQEAEEAASLCRARLNHLGELQVVEKPEGVINE